MCRVLLLSCLCITATTALGQSIRVGVWNIEKLSTTASRGFPELQGNSSLPPRSNADLKRLAEEIEKIGVDALMLTEISPDHPESTEQRPQSSQLNTVVEHLGANWKYFLGRTGEDLRLGFLFNTEKVQLKKIVNLHAPEFPVSGRDVLDRDPFIVWITALDSGTPKNDMLLVCLHLKSQQKPFRNNRMAAVAKLMGDLMDNKTRKALTLPSQNEEPEIVVLGDCNDSSFKRSGFKYMFTYLEGIGFEHIRNSGDYPHTRINGSQIDHVFGSRKFLDNVMVPNSFKVHLVTQSQRQAYRQSLSDHFPVTVDAKLKNDNDFTLEEAVLLAGDERRNAFSALEAEIVARVAAGDVNEDEDKSPLIIDAEIISDNFDALLAPVRRNAGGAEPFNAGLGLRELPAPPSRQPPDTTPDSGLWSAVEIRQRQIRVNIQAGKGATPECKKLIELEQDLYNILQHH